MSQYPNYRQGLQTQGMTRNESPVPLSYPPKPSGQRANLPTQLQFANAAQKNASEKQAAVAGAYTTSPTQSAQPTGSSNTSRKSQRTQYNRSASSSPLGHPPRRVIRTASDYTSSNSNNGGAPPRTEQTRSEVW